MCYFAIQKDASNLIFSKTKLAPKFQRTLPSLELLAVYLGLQNVITLVSDQNFKATVNKIILSLLTVRLHSLGLSTAELRRKMYLLTIGFQTFPNLKIR